MYPSLASVAQLELNALLEETKRAIDSLSRQRVSVSQAIDTARQAKGTDSYVLDETDMQLSYLVHRLNRLEAALEQVNLELDGVETRPALLGSQLALAPPNALVEASQDRAFSLFSRIQEWRQAFLQIFTSKVGLFLRTYNL
jgi:prefoldin subunit 5